MIRHLLDQLRLLGVDLDPGQLADALWLSGYLAPAQPQGPAAKAPAAEPPPKATGKPKSDSVSASEGQRQVEVKVKREETGSVAQGGPLVRVTATDSAESLAFLPKLFRRLRKPYPSRTRNEPDVDRILDHLGETGRIVPFLRPQVELWLEAVLIRDETPSSFLWKRDVEDLLEALVRSGAFRSVRTLGLRPGGKIYHSDRPVSPRRLIDASGRTLVLVATDCVDPLWNDGTAARLLAIWAKLMPAVLIHWLPERLWLGTAIGRGRLRAVTSSLGRPRSDLDQPPQLAEGALAGPLGAGNLEGFAIPITTLSPPALGRWVRLLAQNDGTPVPAVILPDRKLPEKPAVPGAELSAQQRLDLFDTWASPEAQRFLRMLAAVPLSLPIIRLIRSSLLPDSDPGVVAEVVLSGLVRQQAPGDPELATFEIDPDIAKLLPKRASARDLYASVRVVANHLGIRLGERSFEAVLEAPDEVLAEGPHVSAGRGAGADAFVQAAAPILRSLGGRFQRLAQFLEKPPGPTPRAPSPGTRRRSPGAKPRSPRPAKATSERAVTEAAGSTFSPLNQLFIYEERTGEEWRYQFRLRMFDLDIHLWDASTPLRINLREYVAPLYRRIGERRLSSQEDPLVFVQELRALGAQLFDELFPRRIQEILWNDRDKIRSLWVITEQLFVPWELVHLKEPGGSLGHETLFLGQLGLVRWLSSLGFPSDVLKICKSRARYVLARGFRDDEPLQQGWPEAKFLEEWFSAKPAEADRKQLLEMLSRRGSFDLLHFAGHGAANPESFAEPVLYLQGRFQRGQTYVESLEPEDIPRFGRLRSLDDTSPIVFLNACQSGRQDQPIAVFGDFAQAFLKAGACAFIGKLWSASAKPTPFFSEAFYSSLLNGRTLAEATLRARHAAQLSGEEPEWLSYAVYGNPEARLELSDDDELLGSD
jgi:hypothetical protein